ncbi:MAG: STM4011 family radical SAM protein [Deltaproteobacteria bacterium]|nr:STM4011 family radical SAM protein [Deltaproteobacteria bacterium]
MKLDILYRGPLASCNYGCAYCPFAKRVDTRAQLATDRAQWRRFVDWVAAQPATDELGVLVTPWGEALIRRWYQEGLTELSHLPQVGRVAAQTNLSGSLAWIAQANPERLALWCTYHPEWTALDDFLAQARRLADAGVRFSVGVVGQRAYADAARALRAALPAETYVWINAVKALAYSDDEIAGWEAIDPLFRLNNVRYPSAGRACGAGERAITVDGDGTMRRCHFIAEPIGNLYDAAWRDALAPRPCTNGDCHCHIGYVHLDYLELHKVFAAGLLERIPVPEARRGAGVRLPVLQGA